MQAPRTAYGKIAYRRYGITGLISLAVDTAMCLYSKCAFTVLVVKKLTVLIPDDLHKKLKIKAAQDGTSVTDIVIKALKSVT